MPRNCRSVGAAPVLPLPRPPTESALRNWYVRCHIDGDPASRVECRYVKQFHRRIEMFKRLLVIAALSVLIVAAKNGAKNYSFSVSDPSVAGTASLKPGDYNIKVDGEQVSVTDK